MVKGILFTIIFWLLMSALSAQAVTDSFFSRLLFAAGQPVVCSVLRQAQVYRCQVIYTQINRDRHNVPSFTNYFFNYDPSLYFNPASTVKMPLAFLTLEKLHKLHQKKINLFTSIQYDSSYPGQKTAYVDSTSANYLPSLAHYIKKAFLISDNDAYNRMYQFVGQQQINRSLHKKGYADVRILRQFMGFTEDQNRHTNPVRFIREDGETIWRQPMLYNTDTFQFDREVKLGKAYMNSKDSLVNEPFDFTRHNKVSLLDYQQMLQSILFPGSVPRRQRFDVANADREFVLRYLSQLPSETTYPKYDTSQYYNTYVKFFFNDSNHRHLPPGVRVFNKVGWAYGFMTDVAYVVDFVNHIEFMLAATIYVNSDGVLNDDRYDYESIGQPFFYQLGQTVYQYELERPRKHIPDLSAFNIRYEKRDTNDTRPAIKDADN